MVAVETVSCALRERHSSLLAREPIVAERFVATCDTEVFDDIRTVVGVDVEEGGEGSGVWDFGELVSYGDVRFRKCIESGTRGVDLVFHSDRLRTLNLDLLGALTLTSTPVFSIFNLFPT